MLKQILNAKRQYDSLFSATAKHELGLKYVDSKLPNMYHHNFIFVKKNLDEQSLLSLQHSIDRLTEGEFIHLNIAPLVEPQTELINRLSDLGGEYSSQLYMLLSLKDTFETEKESNCTVIRAETKEQIKEGVACLEEIDSVAISPGFAKLKAARKKEVYEEGTLKLYIAYQSGKPVGVCEWLQTGNIVRIEDFSIHHDHQRKRYGTELFNKMKVDAIASGAEYIFLTTYEDETPQHLYRKWGFQTVGAQPQFMWKK